MTVRVTSRVKLPNNTKSSGHEVLGPLPIMVVLTCAQQAMSSKPVLLFPLHGTRHKSRREKVADGVLVPPNERKETLDLVMTWGPVLSHTEGTRQADTLFLSSGHSQTLCQREQGWRPGWRDESLC